MLKGGWVCLGLCVKGEGSVVCAHMWVRLGDGIGVSERVWRENDGRNEMAVRRRLCASASLRLSQTFPYESTCMDDTSLQSLHGTLTSSISGPDLTAHLFDDRQQLAVGGSLRNFHRLYKAHGRWTKITESWSEVGGGGEGGGWNTGAWWRVV